MELFLNGGGPPLKIEKSDLNFFRRKTFLKLTMCALINPVDALQNITSIYNALPINYPNLGTRAIYKLKMQEKTFRIVIIYPSNFYPKLPINSYRALGEILKDRGRLARLRARGKKSLHLKTDFRKTIFRMDIIAGKYKVIKQLGEGSSGQVYLVEHSDLGVKYALKVLDTSLSDHQRFIERFKREAEVLLRFTHEGSIQLRDFGKVEDGRYYMAMDFCNGDVLKKIIEKHGAFTLRESFDILNQLLNALEAAHESGIIHRDIKPDNIMLQTNNTEKIMVKILDFGIAKIKESIEANQNTTMEGASIGTPYYMSPEQASGEADLDHRVDLYALGVVFYELLSGHVPFKGKTVLQTLLMHLTHTAEPIAKSLGLPECVDKFIEKALQKQKQERFQTAAEFRKAAASVLEEINEWEQSRTMQEQFDVHIQARQLNPLPAAPANGKTKILCLDDNEMILNILKHLLEQQGFEIFTASNASSIHDYLFQDGVKLLISDVEMPDMRGTRVCSMLKQSLPDLKIVLFSNIPERELEKASEECHADGWISKNARPQDWLRKIKEMASDPEVLEPQ